jgi:hypothetical protein
VCGLLTQELTVTMHVWYNEEMVQGYVLGWVRVLDKNMAAVTWIG